MPEFDHGQVMDKRELKVECLLSYIQMKIYNMLKHSLLCVSTLEQILL
jgi:hypothetical protein